MVPEAKQEAVIDCFRKVFDREMAFNAAGLTTEEREALRNDDFFLGRINYILTEEKIRLYSGLQALATSAENESVRLKALMEAGRMLYPERFVEGFDPKGGPKSLGKIDLNFELDDSTTAEVARILFESGAIKSAAEDDPPTQAH